MRVAVSGRVSLLGVSLLLLLLTAPCSLLASAAAVPYTAAVVEFAPYFVLPPDGRPVNASVVDHVYDVNWAVYVSRCCVFLVVVVCRTLPVRVRVATTSPQVRGLGGRRQTAVRRHHCVP